MKRNHVINGCLISLHKLPSVEHRSGGQQKLTLLLEDWKRAMKMLLKTTIRNRFEVIFRLHRVPTSSGNHGKPGKSLKKVPCMEKSWNVEKPA